MASTCIPVETWGRLTYKLPSASGILESADVKGHRFVIGRAKGCDLRIGLKMISGHHCYLSKEGNDKIFLYDTSTNGTFVNDHRVVNGQRGEVLDGDLLHLVRKKSSDSNLNFHLVFKKVSNCNGNDLPNSQIGHKNKRLKVETDTAPSTSCEISKTNPVSAENVPVETEQEPENVLVEVQDEEEEQEVQVIDVSDVPDEIIVRPEEIAGVSNTSGNTSNSQSMEDLLKCSLCLEIFHEPVCLQPCMHCYCSGCYSDWLICSKECPQCRTPVQLLAKNHMISNLTEAFLRSHPEKRRSDSEIDILEAKNTITKEQLNPVKDGQCPSDCECDLCAQNSSSYSSGDNSPLPYNRPMQRTCRECPGNASQNSNVSSKPSCSTAVPSTPFVCGPSQSHISCLCCFKQMPDRRQDQNAKPQVCSLCTKTYCHMYWGCTQMSCTGCLNKFEDLRITNNNLTNIVNENVVETRIVVDQAQSKGQSIQDVIKECFKRLDDKTYELIVNLSSSSILCYKCGLSNLRRLMYNYRRDIPNDELPNSVTSRPNCYWGDNCRTQKHNINHAQKYNHICNQTRF